MQLFFFYTQVFIQPLSSYNQSVQLLSSYILLLIQSLFSYSPLFNQPFFSYNQMFIQSLSSYIYKCSFSHFPLTPDSTSNHYPIILKRSSSQFPLYQLNTRPKCRWCIHDLLYGYKINKIPMKCPFSSPFKEMFFRMTGDWTKRVTIFFPKAEMLSERKNQPPLQFDVRLTSPFLSK